MAHLKLCEIRDRLQARPFQPFRVRLIDGMTHAITVPDMAYVTADGLYVATRMGQDDLPDGVTACHPWEVTGVEAVADPHQPSLFDGPASRSDRNRSPPASLARR